MIKYTMANNKNSDDIIVIGAGLSGLYCCNELLKLNNKLNITLLESSDRIGGRTLTIDGFDLGGQWIGKSQSQMLKLIKKYSLKLIKQKYSNNFLSKAEVEFVGMDSPNNKEFNDYLNSLKHLSLDKKYANISVYDHIVSSVSSEETAQLLSLCVESATSIAAKDLSMLFFLFDTFSSKHKFQANWYIKGGSQQISELLYQEIVDKVDLKLYTTVKRVKHFKGVCTVYTNNGQYTSSKVIFCLSPVYLKKIVNDFPIYKKRLFADMFMPAAVKIVLVYSEKFWTRKIKVDYSVLTNCLMTNVLEGPGYSLVCLITGRNAIKFKKLSKTRKYKLVLEQIDYLYSYTKPTKPLFYYEKVWNGCFAGGYKPGKYHDFFKLSQPVGEHYYFASSDTSSEFYGYMEGGVRSAIRVVEEIRNNLNLSKKVTI
jgi:monoamine oxidase